MLKREFIYLGCLAQGLLRRWWCIRARTQDGGRRTVVDLNLEPRARISNINLWISKFNQYVRLTFVLSLILAISFLSNSQSFSTCKIAELESQKYNTYQNLKSLPSITSYDVHSYQLDVKLDPGVNYISGSVAVQFSVLVDSLHEFQLLLSDSMQVDSVVYLGQALNFQHQNRIISAQLPTPLVPNSNSSLKVYYQGTPKPGGLGTFQQDTVSATDTMIWTLSQPYGASEWFPCKDDLYDKADSIKIHVTTPLKYKVATNGLRIGIDTIGTSHTYRYQSNYPIATYLIAIAVGNYQVFEEQYAFGTDSLLIEHYLFQSQTLQQSNAPLYPWMQLFDSLFGEYPFINEKYGHASFTRGGGMEHQTMSFMGFYGGELIAHELAHQWFGDKVTCGSWQDLWLNEGFATYITGLTYEFNSVHDSIYWPVVLYYWKKDAFNFPDQALYRTDTSNVSELFNPVVYQKGASTLHMLRWVVGDSAFFAGVRNYINDPQLEYSFAKTSDLKAHLEASSSMNLDEFFKDWVYGKGFPIYTTTWSQEDSLLSIEVEQLPSHPSIYFFNIPIPYQLHSGSWDSTIVLNPRFSGDRFTLLIQQDLDSISFDPEGWILAKSDVLTEIQEREKTREVELIIYPNPALNELNLVGFEKFESYQIFNTSMQLMQNGNSESKIDISNLNPGTYILQLEAEETIYRSIISKQ